MAGGEIEVRSLVDRRIDGQEIGQGLTHHLHASRAGIRDRPSGTGGRYVHDVERYIQHLGQGDAAEGGLDLTLGWPGEHMATGTGQALERKLLLQVGDEISVLCMDLDQGAELSASQEALDEVLVRQHQAPLVGREELEAGDPAVPHQRLHLGGELLSPPGDRHVQSIVHSRSRRPAQPPVQGGDGRLASIRSGKVEQGGGPARGRGRGAGEEVVRHHRAHCRQLHVSVRIHTARQHEAASGVDDLGPARCLQPRTHCRDPLPETEDIRSPAPVRGDHRAAPYQNVGHFVPSAPDRPLRRGRALPTSISSEAKTPLGKVGPAASSRHPDRALTQSVLSSARGGTTRKVAGGTPKRIEVEVQLRGMHFVAPRRPRAKAAPHRGDRMLARCRLRESPERQSRGGQL